MRFDSLFKVAKTWCKHISWENRSPNAAKQTEINCPIHDHHMFPFKMMAPTKNWHARLKQSQHFVPVSWIFISFILSYIFFIRNIKVCTFANCNFWIDISCYKLKSILSNLNCLIAGVVWNIVGNIILIKPIYFTGSCDILIISGLLLPSSLDNN